MTDRPPTSDSEPQADGDGPTELVETEEGELVERLSGGTATLLLIWLIGVGALSALLAAWIFVLLVYRVRLGVGALFGPFGFYVGLAGASGPCVLWLTGRAQGHGLWWFVGTAARIALVMALILVVILFGAALLLAGGASLVAVAALTVLCGGLALVLAVVWGVATWAADRWIARARSVNPEPRP